jgi:hypothetical protein
MEERIGPLKGGTKSVDFFQRRFEVVADMHLIPLGRRFLVERYAFDCTMVAGWYCVLLSMRAG